MVYRILRWRIKSYIQLGKCRLGAEVLTQHQTRLYTTASSGPNPAFRRTTINNRKPMIAEIIPLFGAIGFSIIYLLLGGGFGGAILIFIIAKMLGK